MQPLHLAALHRPSVKVAELLLAAAPPSSHSALCVHQLLGRSAAGSGGQGGGGGEWVPLESTPMTPEQVACRAVAALPVGRAA